MRTSIYIFIGALALGFSFQNCSKNQFNKNSDNPAPAAAEAEVIPDQIPPDTYDNGNTPTTGSNTGLGNPDEGGAGTQGGQCTHQDTAEHYRALCKSYRDNIASFQIIPPNGSVTGLRGRVLLAGGLVNALTDLRGEVRVVASEDGARANLISGTRGNLVVCGMFVENLVDHRGRLVVVDAFVKNLTSVRGNVTFVGGKVTGEIKDSTSNIRYLQ
jgi:hypothetical protein